MKRILIAFLFVSPLCAADSPLDHVDMLIGTAVHGNTTVGPARPFSMVKPGPDTEMRRNYLHAKYITAFSQLHISGTGGNAQSAALGVMPIVGAVHTDPAQYRSVFDANKTVVEPGYYSIPLEAHGILAEITSTDRVAFYRFTFPKSAESKMLVDVSHAFNPFRGGDIEIVDDRTVVGTGKYNGYMGSDFDIAFRIEFNKAFTSSGVWKAKEVLQGASQAAVDGDVGLGGFLEFDTRDGKPVLMKIGMSYVDVAGAQRNLESECPGWDFDAVRHESNRIWENELSKIEVSGGTRDQKTTFYTALFRTLLSPSVISDVDGRYEGYDGNIHQADGFDYYGEFSLWDTYRTVHPLFSLLQPRRQRDMVVSLLKMSQQGGWLPKWGWSEFYTAGMLGDHAVSVIMDAWAKGIRDFDAEQAFAAMYKNATEKIETVPWGRRGLQDYMSLGYAPEDTGYVKSAVSDILQYGPGGSRQYEYFPRVSGSASATLEFAYNDWSVAEMAQALNRPDEAVYFADRAYNYKNVFDPSVGFMRPRNTDGSWALNPFQPTISGRHNQFYCEGNAWTYTWLVQHDIQGLINLMGGPAPFMEKLDRAFEGVEHDQAYYDPTNEPDMHYPYLYNYAGRPWRTQELVRLVTSRFFSADREHGLPGDDDVGTMSAFYIFSAMGFYPVLPGSTQYVIGSPIFDRVEVALDDRYFGGNRLVIEAENNGEGNPYIQSAALNGSPWNRTYIDHKDLVNNGHLAFKMGSEPNREWGTGPGAAPYSMTQEEPEFVYMNLTAPATSKPDQVVEVTVQVTNLGGVGTAHTRLWRSDRNAHYRMGHLVGEDYSVLAKGESKQLRFEVPLYYRGVTTFKIGELTAEVELPRVDGKDYVTPNRFTPE